MRVIERQEGRFLLAAGVLILGEWTGFACGNFAPAWTWGAWTSGLAFLAAWGWGARRLLMPGLFVLGILLAWRVADDLRRVLDADAGLEGPCETLELEVDAAPGEPRARKGGGYTIDFPSHLGPLPLRVIVPLAEGAARPQVGETWAVEGRLARPREPARPFARRTCSVRRNTVATPVETQPRNCAKALWQRLSDVLAVDLGLGLDWSPELASLNRAILLGRRSELSYERRRMFADAGTIHVFAISGLHVMVVAWLLKELLGYFGLSSVARALGALPLVVAYVILTGARPSAVRAALMTGFLFLAPAFGRRPNGLMAWSLTALIVYVRDPRNVFDLGCALSFVVMLGIVLWMRWVRPFVDPHPRKDLRGAAARFFYGLGISFAAWVAGVPITAFAFGRFTPGGLLANVVVIFAAGIMVRCGAGALVAMFLSFPLAAAFNNAAAACTWVMTAVSERVAALPCASFEVETWSLWTCAAWYAGWLSFFYWLGRFLPLVRHMKAKWW